MVVDKKTIALLIAGVVIAFLLWKGCNSRTNYLETKGLYESSQDTLKTSRNKLGQQEAKITVMTASKKKDFLKMKTDDSTITKLQGLVKEYGGKLAHASLMLNRTREQGTDVTEIIEADTVFTDSATFIYPVYRSEWEEKWSSGFIVASKDSIQRSIVVKNEFNITQGYEKEGFFKPKKLIITVKNLNPNTSTSELRTFTVKKDKKKFSLGVGAMYGYGVLDYKPHIVAGVSVHYSLIKF